MEKEPVKVFDLQAAFKALDEIETPKTKEGLRANRIDLKERFAAKDAYSALVEDYYNVGDHEALEEAQEDRESEIAKAKLARIEKIVDLDAETEDDLLPSYVGKVIIQCPQCMTLFYKKPEDIEKSEENPDVVNINEVCQHCGNTSGYTLIGKVDKVGAEEAENYDVEDFEDNELDLDFGEPTEEVSPEGTGGGFEEETVEDSEGSEEDLDLNLEEVELEPAEESLQVNEAVEDSGSEDKDETEVTVTLGEIKDVAEEAGKAVVKAEVEEKEEVKEVTDKVVEKEVEVEKEVLTEDLAEEKKVCQDCGKEICECDKALAEEETTVDEKPTEAQAIEEPVKEVAKEEITAEEKPILKEAQSADEIDQLLWDVANSFDESLEEYNKTIKEDKVSDSEFRQMINSPTWKEFDEDLTENLEEDINFNEIKSRLGDLTYRLEHAGEEYVTEKSVEENLEECDRVESCEGEECEEGYKGTPEERTTHLEYIDDNPTDGEAVLPDNIEKQLTETTDVEAGLEAALASLTAKDESLNEGAIGDTFKLIKEFGGWENPEAIDKAEAIIYAFDGFNKELDKDPKYLKNGKHKYLFLKNMPTDLQAEFVAEIYKKTAAYGPENKFTDEDVMKCVNILLKPRMTAEAYAKFQELIAQPTTEGLKEHVQDRPAPVEDETELHGMDNAVVDCETDMKVIAHSEDEKPLACKGYKEELAEELEEAKDKEKIKWTDKYVLYGTNTKGDILVQKEITNDSGKAGDVKALRDQILTDNDEVVDVFVSRFTQSGEEKPLDSYTATRPGHEFDGLDDFEDKYFDEHINEYLKEVYSNVENYKTTNCRVKDNKLFVEGTISFKSGKAKNTVFEFVPTKGQLGYIICEGYNKDLSEEKAFTIKGTLEGRHTFVTESVNYKYTINETLVEGLK